MAVICALIAAFNEERHVGEVVAATAPQVTHVLVVDDGSIDATAERARAAGAEVIRHDMNLGKGCAIRTGLDRVLQGSYTHVLFIDADFQRPWVLPHPSSKLELLVEHAMQKS